ncbi:HAD family phosphatase [bacterium]|nr:HAD family phosphatase [bacterium]NBX82893.1 HAD family phosphatase [bacterium]
MKPLPLTQLVRKPIKALFSDLDDTITKNSQIMPSTLQAIHDLNHHGYPVVIVSGRPAGWADTLMRLLPLSAMIFENGAGIMWREGKRITTHCLAAQNDLKSQKNHLTQLFNQIQQQIPDAKLATDQPYRLFDFAIDFNEEPPLLSPDQVHWMMNFLKKDSAVTAKLSSIHINFWVGHHTKLTACEFWLNRFGSNLGIHKENIVFSGDSPNDEPLFEYFPNSVGVANVKYFLPQLKHPPRFMTVQESGTGFEELVSHILGRVP